MVQKEEITIERCIQLLTVEQEVKMTCENCNQVN